MNVSHTLTNIRDHRAGTYAETLSSSENARVMIMMIIIIKITKRSDGL